MKVKLILILSTILLSCKDDNPEPGVSIKSSSNPLEFEMVWQKNTTNALLCNGSFVYSDGVVFFLQDGESNARDNIVSLDKNTGDTLWIWQEGPMYTGNRQLAHNTLYFNGGTSIYSLNPITGKTNWEFIPTSNLAFLNLHVTNHGVFVSYQDRKPNATENETILFQLDRYGNASELFRLRAGERDGFTCNFEHITPWVHPNSDLHLICESRSWNLGNLNAGRGEYFIYNLTADSMYWDLSSYFDEVDIGGKGCVKNDVFYFYSGWDKTAAIDLVNKTTLWSIYLPTKNITGSIQSIVNFYNNVYLSPGKKGIITVLDQASGRVVHTLNDLGNEYYGYGFITWNELLWFTTSKALYAVSNQGKIAHQLADEDLIMGRGGSYTNGLAIDNNLGYIYTTRGSDFLCVKLKD